jgi:hypothetical protein
VLELLDEFELLLLDEFDDEFELVLLLWLDDEFELLLLDWFADEFELALPDWFDDEFELLLLDVLPGAGGGGTGRVVGGATVTVVVGAAVVTGVPVSDWMGRSSVGSGSSRPSHAAATPTTRPRAPSPAAAGSLQFKRL